jgi:hypothetical protein
MKHLKLFVGIAAIAAAMTSCSKDDYNNPTPPAPTVKSNVVSGSGDLTNSLTQFRTLIGDQLNTTPNQTTGRREVNWDGVAVNFTNNANFPLDFFNNTDAAGPNGRKRGLQYAINGTSFRVDSTTFSEIDASYANTFKAFSPKKLIAPVGSNVTEIVFKVPGTATDASVKGFGLIFSDVDNANYTTVEFFEGNKSLGVFKAPVRSDANGFSFLGVQFPDNKVTRVKITAGNAALAAGVKDLSEGGNKDLVVLDDFFYSEPVSIN